MVSRYFGHENYPCNVTPDSRNGFLLARPSQSLGCRCRSMPMRYRVPRVALLVNIHGLDTATTEFHLHLALALSLG